MRNRNYFIECVIKGAQWAKLVQQNYTRKLTMGIQKVYEIILYVMLTIYAWKVVHKKDIEYTLRKLALMMLICVINAIIITNVFQMGVSIFPNDFIKESMDTNIVYYSLKDINRVQSTEYWYLFFPTMAIFSITLSYFECRKKRIGNYSYNQKLNKRKFLYEVLISFSKISTLETIFRLFIDVAIIGTFSNFLINVFYLFVLFAGFYIIYAIKNFLFGEGEKGSHSLVYKTYSNFFVNFSGALLSFIITFHKVHKNFSFIVSNHFLYFFIFLIFYFVFYGKLSSMIDKYEFYIKKEMKKRVSNDDMIKNNKQEVRYIIGIKVIVNNLYYFFISFWPTLLGLDAAFIWFFRNPIVAIIYFLVLVIKTCIEIKFELLDFENKVKK